MCAPHTWEDPDAALSTPEHSIKSPDERSLFEITTHG